VFVKLLVWQPPGLPDLFRRPCGDDDNHSQCGAEHSLD